MGFFSNLFNRSSRVAKGQANKAMGSIEDATFESTVKQSVRDMKTELNKAVRASAEAMSNYNRLEAEYAKAERQAEEWQDRAKMAIKAGNEELAKKALGRKKQCDERVASMQGSVDMARATSEKLKQQVQSLRGKIDEAERNASTLIARRNAARAQKKVAEALAGVGDADNAFAALNEFEDTVEKEEAKAAAFEEMAATGGMDAELEEEFAELNSTSVDDELAALKAEMNA
ncbi:MAG: PspA/IM30 family protein [Bacteroidota bacterium]